MILLDGSSQAPDWESDQRSKASVPSGESRRAAAGCWFTTNRHPWNGRTEAQGPDKFLSEQLSPLLAEAFGNSLRTVH
jgi:hypothetical protein